MTTYAPVDNLGAFDGVFVPVARGAQNVDFTGRAEISTIKMAQPFGPPWRLPLFLKHNFLADASRVDPTWNPGYAYTAKSMIPTGGGGGGGGGTHGYPI
jgi:hypothetical protein